MDYIVRDHGSVCVILAQTPECQKHLAEHMPEDVQMWGLGYVVEPRYTPAIIADLDAEGFVGNV